MSVTYYDLVHAVGSCFKALPTLTVQTLEEITEGIPTTPVLHVYFDDAETDAVGETDRTSLDGAIRQTAINVKVDGYARQRSHLGADLKAQLDLIDTLDTRLCEQTQKPYFGLPAIQVFHWKFERTTFVVGANPGAVPYAGCALTIQLYVY